MLLEIPYLFIIVPLESTLDVLWTQNGLHGCIQSMSIERTYAVWDGTDSSLNRNEIQV